MSDTDTSAQHDWAALRRLAQKATQKPWLTWSNDVVVKDSDGDDLIICGVGSTAAMRSHPYSVPGRAQIIANRDYIAAAHPAAVLALLDQRDAMLAALRETLLLARLKWGNLDEDANEIFDKAEDAIAKAEGRTP